MIINIRLITLFALISLLISSSVLFHTKHKVQNLRSEMNMLSKKILSTQEDIHILQAEWGYLTQPDNIRVLAKKKLDLKAIESSEIKTISKRELEQFYKVLRDKDALKQDIAA